VERYVKKGLYTGTDHKEAAGSGYANTARPLDKEGSEENRDIRSYLLHVEERVQWDGCGTGEETEASGEGERATEETSDKPESGQGDTEGSSEKDLLSRPAKWIDMDSIVWELGVFDFDTIQG